MSPLIITNGESGVDAIRATGIEADIISWDDVLHDGPVPETDDADELRQIRAAFIEEVGWSESRQVLERLRRRDNTLEGAIDAGRPVVIWLEHDLYDQLQRLQIISQAAGGDLWEVPMDHYVAETSLSDLAEAWARRKAIVAPDRLLAARAWHLFRQPDPMPLAAFRSRLEAGTHLQNALGRWIESFPDRAAGLNRTERRVLSDLLKGARTGAWLFQATQESEKAKFRGDASFQLLLSGLAGLLERVDGGPLNSGDVFRADLVLRGNGVEVVEGRADRVDICGLSEWRGGSFMESGRHWRRTAEGSLVIREAAE